ncbi:hypothetical protein CsatA_029788 [Cannabis sativa]
MDIDQFVLFHLPIHYIISALKEQLGILKSFANPRLTTSHDGFEVEVINCSIEQQKKREALSTSLVGLLEKEIDMWKEQLEIANFDIKMVHDFATGGDKERYVQFMHSIICSESMNLTNYELD